MTTESHKYDGLLGLLSDLVDGSLTAAQTARLRELLRDDPGAQDLYLGFMGVHAQLHLDYGGGATPVAMPGWSSMPLTAPSFPPIGLAPNGGAAPGNLARGAAGHTSFWRQALAFAGGLLAAILACVAVAWYWSRDRRGNAVVNPAKATTGDVAHRPLRIGADDGFAMVAKLDAVAWERAEGPHPREGDVLAAGRLGLRSGRLMLAFLNGVMLTIEGPADLELVSIDRVICHRGKIRTHVPPGAEGFVVASQGSKVTDLGTDFGLNVEADGRARMMVFEGSADASVLKASGAAQRNRSITAHRALEIDPSSFQLSDIEANSESFVAPLKQTTPPLGLDPSYRDVVLAARPWSYWRFESMAGGAVPNEVPGRPPLRAFGPVRLTGTGNRTVAFGFGTPDRYMFVENRWELPRDPGYAVELWFSPERIGLAELAGLFLPRGGVDYDHLFQLELTSRGQESLLFRRASIRFLHRWPLGFKGGDNLFSDYYVPYRWHHVVAQLGIDRMELYVNGEAHLTLSVNPDRTTEACQLILGQLKPSPRPSEPWENRPFVGQIDEVALYDHPLSAEEVRRHYKLGTSGDRPSGP
jgi:Concanavalin A-like lectin/glucanases superfamily